MIEYRKRLGGRAILEPLEAHHERGADVHSARQACAPPSCAAHGAATGKRPQRQGQFRACAYHVARRSGFRTRPRNQVQKTAKKIETGIWPPVPDQ